jgi:tetratricopeptide (TPR) repeat protein
MTKYPMTKEVRMTNDELTIQRNRAQFVIRASSFLRHSSFSVCAALAIVSALHASADEVVVSTGPDAQGRTRRMGEVVDFTGAGLVLRVAGGAETTIPAERVLEVRAEWSPSHRAGDELFAEGKFAEALEKYRQAVGQEQRGWVRRRLTSQAVWCYRNLGQHEFAASSFLSLASQDPATPHFDAIPLSWTSAQPGAAFEAKLRKWLDDQNPVISLVGASWLLTSADRSAAAERLRTLTGADDSRVALLAQAQLWRTQQATAKADDVARWRSAAERLPELLRSGPYYVIGQSMARLGAGEEAALVLLRVPVLYPQHRELAAESLFAAARELEKLNRADEALRLYQELWNNYRENQLADLARQRLEQAAP